MTALTLLGWAGAICLAVVLAAITVLVVVAVIREVRKPSKTDSTIIGKDRP